MEKGQREIFLKQKLEEEENRTRLNVVLNSQKRGKAAKRYRRKMSVIACAHAQWEKKRGGGEMLPQTEGRWKNWWC